MVFGVQLFFSLNKNGVGKILNVEISNGSATGSNKLFNAIFLKVYVNCRFRNTQLDA